jgi:hypothetical protein
MAVKTKCQTPGCIYGTQINDQDIEVWVEFPFALKLTAKQAKLLERNLHNAVELAITASLSAVDRA